MVPIKKTPKKELSDMAEDRRTLKTSLAFFTPDTHLKKCFPYTLTHLMQMQANLIVLRKCKIIAVQGQQNYFMTFKITNHQKIIQCFLMQVTGILGAWSRFC